MCRESEILATEKKRIKKKNEKEKKRGKETSFLGQRK